MDERDRLLILLVLIILLYTLIATMLIIMFFKRKRDIKDLQKQVKHIREHSLPTTIKSKSTLVDQEMIREINLLIEDLIAQRRSLSAKDEETRVMVTGIAHDFRTPLTSISGYVQILLEQNEALNAEQREKFLRIIESRTGSLAALVENFYTYSSLMSFDMQPKLEAMDPLVPLRQTLAEHYVELEAHFERVTILLPEENYVAQIDRTYLARAYGNLLMNALKYGVGELRVSSGMLNDQLQVTFTNDVKDGGEVARVKLNRLFDRYFSINWSGGASSTGLGLPITRILLKQLGGDLTADLAGDKISFRCLIPLEKE